MQSFVSNRDIVIRSSKSGHAIRFLKGVPQQVPPAMHEEVLERGILPVAEDGSPVEPTAQEIVKDEPKIILAPEDEDERRKQILGAMVAIVKKNDSSMFTGGGVPQSAAVSQILGWRVDARDIRQLWEKHREQLLTEKTEG